MSSEIASIIAQQTDIIPDIVNRIVLDYLRSACHCTLLSQHCDDCRTLSSGDRICRNMLNRCKKNRPDRFKELVSTNFVCEICILPMKRVLFTKQAMHCPRCDPREYRIY